MHPQSLPCKPALAVLVEYRVDCRGGAGVVTGARVYWRLVERQPVQCDDFFPSQLVGGTPAHRSNIGRLAVPGMSLSG